MTGEKDLSNLFQRVSALEQEDADFDQSISRIIKNYSSTALSARVVYSIHQYRICGDTNPIYSATTTFNTYI